MDINFWDEWNGEAASSSGDKKGLLGWDWSKIGDTIGNITNANANVGVTTKVDNSVYMKAGMLAVAVLVLYKFMFKKGKR